MRRATASRCRWAGATSTTAPARPSTSPATSGSGSPARRCTSTAARTRRRAGPAAKTAPTHRERPDRSERPVTDLFEPALPELEHGLPGPAPGEYVPEPGMRTRGFSALGFRQFRLLFAANSIGDVGYWIS